MSKMMLGRLLVSSAALALAACGGGGGDIASTPAPTPQPTTPTPTPTVSPAIFPSVTTSTDFAVLGLEADDRNTPASALARDGFSVRYDAASQSYFMDLPTTLTEFRFETSSETSAFWRGFVATGFYDGTFIDVFKPSASNPEFQLTYTSFGITSGYYSPHFGFFAFGIPTPSSGVPVTGSATYDAYVRGSALNSFASIRGDATLQFNFGAGTLGGRFDPIHELNGVSTNLGTYNFVNTVFGVGSTTFSGGLSHSSISTLGAFDGQFTGPAAQELMARWTAPYLQPGSQLPAEMFGIWVGKKQ